MADFEKAHAAMEARGPIFFAGRETELLVLEDAIFSDKARVITVAGVGGVGKTTLIREFQRRNLNRLSRDVVWIDGSHIDLDRLISEDYVQELIPSEATLVVIDNGEKVAGVLQYVSKQICNRAPDTKIILSTRLLPRNSEVITSLDSLSLKATMDIWASNLVDFSSEESERLYKAVGGNPLVATLAGRLLRDGHHEIKDFENYVRAFECEGIIDADGKSIVKDSKQEIELFSGLVVASDEVINYLSANPSKMNDLTPRQFEEFIAELLSRQGYEIQLTPMTRDGGKDIYAARRDSLGSFLYIVECKKNAPHRPVDVGVVRQLYGVIQEERVSGGIVATTSYFSPDAKNFCDRVKYQVGLKDYVDIQKWLKEVVHMHPIPPVMKWCY